MFNEHTYLYVDDDAYSCQVMQLVMRKVMGVERLVMFEDSSNFLRRAQALPQRPDVILLDIHVRPHDGFAMLSMLRSTPEFQNARVIALTASVMSEEIEQLRQHGFDGAIAKPLSVQTFPGLMQRVVAGDAVWHVE